MERAPGFIGTAGVPLVRQVNINYMSELILDIEDVKDLIRTATYVGYRR